MITDLFSHKIHASSADWPEKLVTLVSIFSEFDGQPYNRAAIEARLQQISPRTGMGYERDESKFRDEISAYPSYLGIYRLEIQQGRWYFYLNETAKQLLLSEEPDVAAFMRLQLSLFQLPNGKGGVYSDPAGFHIQANARDSALALIRGGVQVAPLRVICKALIADAELRRVDLAQAAITVDELAALVNHRPIYTAVSPLQTVVTDALQRVRSGSINVPAIFENRFHILDHLELFTRSSSGRVTTIALRRAVDALDKSDLTDKIRTIASLEVGFSSFAAVQGATDLANLIKSGEWGRYFDGLTTLDPEAVKILTKEWQPERVSVSQLPAAPPVLPSTPASQLELLLPPPAAPQEASRQGEASPRTYPFKQRSIGAPSGSSSARPSTAADPEVTRIKRQRRNLAHQLILKQLEDHLESLGAEPKETEHIDSFAKIPTNGPFLFEVKSGGENLLDQIRKAVSQLYEYKFRYQDEIAESDAITLCLVLPGRPDGIPWLEDYLCADRNIAVCWFEEDGRLGYFEKYQAQVQHLLAG
ncbi:hypothetical protein [Hymenobacter cavernae]|uniref:Restriction endonuclease n=1 Tax=Hymenobacter cavernae TaxID=2044852 RepID=A0ABQ1UWN3_9BACT|nr:hypothetical protein [Hymenobacter cavernae]GGF28805.1 hypothetical protein GCM10011383_45660 [Hymenobacter cavernae]